MKKATKTIVLILIFLLIVLAVLFVPYKSYSYDDGGTKDYRALAATYVKWHKDAEIEGEVKLYEGFSWYLYPDSTKSIDELWKIKH